MQPHRTIEVGDATLECTVCGLGAPVVLLANAGCSTGYFDHLARARVTGGFQTISINMRGVGGSSGSLDGATLHDLAGTSTGQSARRLPRPTPTPAQTTITISKSHPELTPMTSRW